MYKYIFIKTHIVYLFFIYLLKMLCVCEFNIDLIRFLMKAIPFKHDLILPVSSFFWILLSILSSILTFFLFPVCPSMHNSILVYVHTVGDFRFFFRTLYDIFHIGFGIQKNAVCLLYTSGLKPFELLCDYSKSVVVLVL